MSVMRIAQLNQRLNQLNATLKDLKKRSDSLRREVSGAQKVQEEISGAVATAEKRVSALASLGLRSEFLEELIRPVQGAPDCSGVGSTVKKELDETEAEIQRIKNQIYITEQERQRVRMEVACGQEV